MKTRVVWTGLLMMALGLATATCFAARATAMITATIRPGFAVCSAQGLRFGAISSGSVGTVAVSTAGFRTASRGVRLVESEAVTSSAECVVSGGLGAGYYVILPESVTVSDGSHSMTVADFRSSPRASGAVAGGTGRLKVGATLRVKGNEAPGAYEGSFDIVLSYN